MSYKGLNFSFDDFFKTKKSVVKKPEKKELEKREEEKKEKEEEDATSDPFMRLYGYSIGYNAGYEQGYGYGEKYGKVVKIAQKAIDKKENPFESLASNV